MRKILTILFSVITLIYVFGCSKEKQSQIDIGAALLLTGDNALWGQNAKKAIDLLVEETNNTGGIHGKKIRVIYEDTKGDPKTSIAAFNKLTEVDKVPVVMGDMLSSTTLAMASLSDEKKVPLIGISCSSPAVTQAGPYIYRVWPSDLYEGEVAATWAYNKGYKNISIVYLNNDYGDGLRNVFKSKFISLGGKLLDEETFTDQDKDFRSIAIKIKNKNPDIIYIVGYYENTAFIVKQFREMEIKSLLLGTSSSVHQRLIEIAGKSAEGFLSALVNDFDLENLNIEQKSFLKKFREKYGADPDWASTHGGDAFLVVKSCLLSGSMTGEEIKTCIDTQKEFRGINLGIIFDKNGDITSKPIVIKEVVNGKFISKR